MQNSAARTEDSEGTLSGDGIHQTCRCESSNQCREIIISHCNVNDRRTHVIGIGIHRFFRHNGSSRWSCATIRFSVFAIIIMTVVVPWVAIVVP